MRLFPVIAFLLCLDALPQLRADPPGPVTLVSPANGATLAVGSVSPLRWEVPSDALSINIYFGATSPPQINFGGYPPHVNSVWVSAEVDTTYYWRIEALNADGSTSSPTWSFYVQPDPPAAFSLFSPANGATGVPVHVDIQWTGSSGATSYDVRLGTTPSPPVIDETSDTIYTLSSLDPGTTYYWKITAKNDFGSTDSATRSFTTQTSAPDEFSLLSPSDGAEDVPLDPRPVLTWEPSNGATSYDVHLGTVGTSLEKAGLTSTSYTLPNPQADTEYNWRIVAKNSDGSTSSATWSFRTAVAPPVSFDLEAPANGATGVPINTELSWESTPGTQVYTIYFGTTPSPPWVDVRGNQPTTFSVQGLQPNTKYYWRIVAGNAAGETSSPTWSFTTQSTGPPDFSLLSPANNATGVPLGPAPALRWQASGGASSYDVYFGWQATPPLVSASQTSTSYTPGELLPNTRYYWRIAAKNSDGVTNSETRSFTTEAVPPYSFGLLSPPNGMAGTSLKPTLKWEVSIGAPVYELYFGTTASPPFLYDIYGRQEIGTVQLEPHTTYYWRIVARNLFGKTPSPTWSFTTGGPPAPVELVSPADTADGVSLTPMLRWKEAAGAAEYDVFFGTSGYPPLFANGIHALSYAPGKLKPGTTYFWRLEARNGDGTSTSAIRSFTTSSEAEPEPEPQAPAAFELTSPSNDAEGVSPTPLLRWQNSAEAESYSVYLGTSQPPPLASANQTLTSFQAPTLEPGTTYFWRVEAANDAGTTSSTTWAFTTANGSAVEMPAVSAVVSAAGFGSGPVSPGQLVSIFGANLSTRSLQAASTPLPTSLGGVSISFDGTPALLLFVSSNQINAQVPENVAAGVATLLIRNGSMVGEPVEIAIAPTAPGLFTFPAGEDSPQPAAAVALIVAPGGARREQVIYDPTIEQFVPLETDEATQVYLLLFGTGFRGAQGAISATVGGQGVPVLGAAAQPEFVGLDQVNIGPIPMALRAQGPLPLVLTVDGAASNVVMVAF